MQVTQLENIGKNERLTVEQDKKEICTIRIIVPVDTDEQAIGYKKKIAEVLKDNPEALTHFAIAPKPPPPK